MILLRRISGVLLALGLTGLAASVSLGILGIDKSINMPMDFKVSVVAMLAAGVLFAWSFVLEELGGEG